MSDEVVEETINAYRVRLFDHGAVQVESGRYVGFGPTYYKALKQYAGAGIVDDDGPIRDDTISLNWGFTPEEILDAVVSQPLEVVLADLEGDAKEVDPGPDDALEGLHNAAYWCDENGHGDLSGIASALYQAVGERVDGQ